MLCLACNVGGCVCCCCGCPVGLGFKISFPESSQDMLKSLSTARVRLVMMCGATTSLWTPNANSITGREDFVYTIWWVK